MVVDDAVRVAGPRGHRRARVRNDRRCAQCPGLLKARRDAWCPCATARPAAPTHSAGSSGAALSGDDAKRRGWPEHLPDRRPARREKTIPAKRAGPRFVLRPRLQDRLLDLRAQEPRDNCAAATRRVPRTHRTTRAQPRLGLLPAMPPPMRRGRRNRTLSGRRPERSIHSQSNEPTANGPPVRACVSGPPRPASLGRGPVIADRTLRRGPDVPPTVH